jgi:cephalosporin-C deacetylase-like acetyl esterase
MIALALIASVTQPAIALQPAARQVPVPTFQSDPAAIPVAPQSPSVAVPHPSLDAIQLFCYDRNLPIDARMEPYRSNAQYRAWTVSYYSANDQRVPAILVEPATRPAGKMPCILLMHGLGMNKLGLQMMWATFVQKGYALLAIDAQYHGDRKPKETLDLFGLHPYATRDMLVQSIVDIRRGVDFLQTLPEIDPDRIGYVGFSMGGILGSVACGVDERFKAPVLCLAGGNFRLMVETSEIGPAKNARAAGLKPDASVWYAMDAVDPVRWIPFVSPRPVLFVNGDHDVIVPVACAKALHAAAKGPKQIFWYQGDHVPPTFAFPKILSAITNWLDAHLKG